MEGAFWVLLGHTPSTAETLQKKFRKISGKTPETLSERFLEFPSRVRLGSSKPYNSRHLRLPEHFQNFLPLSTTGGASFFSNGSGEGHCGAGHATPSSTEGISELPKIGNPPLLKRLFYRPFDEEEMIRSAESQAGVVLWCCFVRPSQ